ncbi:intraflagellar transport protein 43 homolog isoform X2 [Microcebus murinus]|uniref:intraflagellar transport protein 43 homolog isoform X2 n=1 Tax=Microcebus murinus TaxID=30608 RepID=UPI003F6C690F
MEALSGRPRAPPGEARPPVRAARGAGAPRRGLRGSERARAAGPGASGSRLPAAPRAHLRPPGRRAPAAPRRNGVRTLAAALPAAGSRGAAPASAKSAVGPSPFPRWVRGSLLSALVRLSLTSWVFSHEPQREGKAHCCPPLQHSTVSELSAGLRISAAPIPPHSWTLPSRLLLNHLVEDREVGQMSP